MDRSLFPAAEDDKKGAAAAAAEMVAFAPIAQR
jgi:hypothetical protein